MSYCLPKESSCAILHVLSVTCFDLDYWHGNSRVEETAITGGSPLHAIQKEIGPTTTALLLWEEEIGKEFRGN